MADERPAFAEFFAGIGLARLALEAAGWRCAVANEIDPKKCAIYAQNFPAADLIQGDIRDLSLDDVAGARDLWWASFPCIDLSLAGNRRGLAGEHSGTYWPFVDLLKVAATTGVAPARLIIENVTGFLSSAGGADLAQALAALSGCGYYYDMIVLDARWFAPQSRPRLFILAERRDGVTNSLLPCRPLEFATPLRPAAVRRFVDSHPQLAWAHFVAPPLPELGPQLRDVIESDRSDLRWWSAEATTKLLDAMSPVNRARLTAMLATARTEYGTVYRRVRGGNTMTELRWDGLAGCLRTPRGGSSKQFLLEAGDGRVRVRNLTIRECARLQGVPDSFAFDVPENQAWFGLGDAVCVPAVRWLVEAFCGVAAADRQLAAV
jgi:DNA (cytosine-5)-methyltransferase 1